MPRAPVTLTSSANTVSGKTCNADGAFGLLAARLDPPSDYNFEHYRLRHLLAEFARTIAGIGVQPGADAPDFEVLATDGSPLRLSSFLGRPVLLHFVSYTCPITRGGVATKHELHRLYGDRVEFIDLVVRQAHPGGRHGAYRSFEDKLRDARAYKAEEHITWRVAADDLEGSVQRAYGTMCAPIFLVDAAGKVVYYGMWGQAPPLREAMDELLARGGTGPLERNAVDRMPHLAGAIVYGRRGPASGGWRALVDLEFGFPGANLLMTFGWLARPLIGPLARRTTPLPAAVRLGSVAALVGAVVMLLCAVRCRRSAS